MFRENDTHTSLPCKERKESSQFKRYQLLKKKEERTKELLLIQSERENEEEGRNRKLFGSFTEQEPNSHYSYQLDHRKYSIGNNEKVNSQILSNENELSIK